MTRMLGSVRNKPEASILLRANVDIIDIKEPSAGALGAVALTDVVDTVNYVKAFAPRTYSDISATIGDLPMVAGIISNAIQRMHSTGVDIIKVGVFSSGLSAELISMLSRHAAEDKKIVLVFFADRLIHWPAFSFLAAQGLYGVMLDTANKQNGSLTTLMSMGELDGFVRGAQAAGLKAGLAGSLQASDIDNLLELDADYLGFRGALCRKQERASVIDENAVKTVRDLIPLTRQSSKQLARVAN
ncbi:MAG: (5-formylfuran-3-yl)methyl phosphate synthase [Gammaproteobacteria bacterium]